MPELEIALTDLRVFEQIWQWDSRVFLQLLAIGVDQIKFMQQNQSRQKMHSRLFPGMGTNFKYRQHMDNDSKMSAMDKIDEDRIGRDGRRMDDYIILDDKGDRG